MSSSTVATKCSPIQSDDQVVLAYLKYQAALCFRILYDRYAGKIYAKALTMLKDEVLAEDATQEIFTKLFLNLDKFGGRSKFSTWVYSVTYNYCIDSIRRRKKTKSIFTDEIDNPPDLVDAEVLDEALFAMEVEQLQHVLGELSEGDRSVLLMKYQDDMSIKDIADIIQKNESAVKMQIKRAKEKAKKIHEELFPHHLE